MAKKKADPKAGDEVTFIHSSGAEFPATLLDVAEDGSVTLEFLPHPHAKPATVTAVERDDKGKERGSWRPAASEE